MRNTSYKNRWVEPPGRAERDEYRSLRRELKGSRTSKPRRLEIEARLDEITGKKPESILSELPPVKPTNKDLQALCTRVEAAKRRESLSEKSIPLARTPAGLEAFLAKMLPDRERAVCRARSATDAERASVMLAELPDHRLNVLAREKAAYLWQADLSRPRPDVERIVEGIIKGWLNREPYNRHDVHGNSEIVAAAVADTFRLLAEKDAGEQGWFIKRAGSLFDTAALPEAASVTVPISSPVVCTPLEIAPPPTAAAGDVDQRVNLVLASDPHLTRLAAHSREYDSAIRTAVGHRLNSHGYADGTFLAGLYNASRPQGLSAFPPRTL